MRNFGGGLNIEVRHPPLFNLNSCVDKCCETNCCNDFIDNYFKSYQFLLDHMETNKTNNNEYKYRTSGICFNLKKKNFAY